MGRRNEQWQSGRNPERQCSVHEGDGRITNIIYLVSLVSRWLTRSYISLVGSPDSVWMHKIVLCTGELCRMSRHTTSDESLRVRLQGLNATPNACALTIVTTVYALCL